MNPVRETIELLTQEFPKAFKRQSANGQFRGLTKAINIAWYPPLGFEYLPHKSHYATNISELVTHLHSASIPIPEPLRVDAENGRILPTGEDAPDFGSYIWEVHRQWAFEAHEAGSCDCTGGEVARHLRALEDVTPEYYRTHTNLRREPVEADHYKKPSLDDQGARLLYKLSQVGPQRRSLQFSREYIEDLDTIPKPTFESVQPLSLDSEYQQRIPAQDRYATAEDYPTLPEFKAASDLNWAGIPPCFKSLLQVYSVQAQFQEDRSLAAQYYSLNDVGYRALVTLFDGEYPPEPRLHLSNPRNRYGQSWPQWYYQLLLQDIRSGITLVHPQDYAAFVRLRIFPSTQAQHEYSQQIHLFAEFPASWPVDFEVDSSLVPSSRGRPVTPPPGVEAEAERPSRQATPAPGTASDIEGTAGIMTTRADKKRSAKAAASPEVEQQSPVAVTKNKRNHEQLANSCIIGDVKNDSLRTDIFLKRPKCGWGVAMPTKRVEDLADDSGGESSAPDVEPEPPTMPKTKQHSGGSLIWFNPNVPSHNVAKVKKADSKDAAMEACRLALSFKQVSHLLNDPEFTLLPYVALDESLVVYATFKYSNREREELWPVSFGAGGIPRVSKRPMFGAPPQCHVLYSKPGPASKNHGIHESFLMVYKRDTVMRGETASGSGKLKPAPEWKEDAYQWSFGQESIRTSSSKDHLNFKYMIGPNSSLSNLPKDLTLGDFCVFPEIAPYTDAVLEKRLMPFYVGNIKWPVLSKKPKKDQNSEQEPSTKSTPKTANTPSNKGKTSTPASKVAPENAKPVTPVVLKSDTPASSRLKRVRTKDASVEETPSKKRKSGTECKDQETDAPEPPFTVSYAQAVEFVENYEKAEVPEGFSAPALNLEHQDAAQICRVHLGNSELGITKQQEAFNDACEAQFNEFKIAADKYPELESKLDNKTSQLMQLKAEIASLETELSDQKSLINTMASNLLDKINDQPMYRMVQRVATTVPQIVSYQPSMANAFVKRLQRLRSSVDDASHINPKSVAGYRLLLEKERKEDERVERQDSDADESESQSSKTSDEEAAMWTSAERPAGKD